MAHPWTVLHAAIRPRCVRARSVGAQLYLRIHSIFLETLLSLSDWRPACASTHYVNPSRQHGIQLSTCRPLPKLQLVCVMHE